MKRCWVEVHYLLKLEEDDGTIRTICDDTRAQKAILWRRALERVEISRTESETEDINPEDVTTDLVSDLLPPSD